MQLSGRCCRRIPSSRTAQAMSKPENSLDSSKKNKKQKTEFYRQVREIQVGTAERSIRKGKVLRTLNLLLWKDTERLAALGAWWVCLLSSHADKSGDGWHRSRLGVKLGAAPKGQFSGSDQNYPHVQPSFSCRTLPLRKHEK